MALSLSTSARTGAAGTGTGKIPVSAELRRKRNRRRLRTLGFLSPWLIGFSVFFQDFGIATSQLVVGPAPAVTIR